MNRTWYLMHELKGLSGCNLTVARTEIQNSLAIVLRHLERREEEGLIRGSEKMESEQQFRLAAEKIIECLDDPAC